MSTSTIDPQITQLPQQTFQQAAPGATPPAPQAQPAAPPVNHGHNLLKALVNGAHQAGQLMYNVNNPDQAVERSNQQQDQLKQLQNQHDEEYRKVIYAGITDPNSTPEQRQALGTLLQHLGDFLRSHLLALLLMAVGMRMNVPVGFFVFRHIITGTIGSHKFKRKRGEKAA